MATYLGKTILTFAEADTAVILARLLGQTREHWQEFLVADRFNGPRGWVGKTLYFPKGWKRGGEFEVRYPDYILAEFIGDRDLLALLRFAARYARIPTAALIRGRCAAATLSNELGERLLRMLQIGPTKSDKRADQNLRDTVTYVIPPDSLEQFGLAEFVRGKSSPGVVYTAAA